MGKWCKTPLRLPPIDRPTNAFLLSGRKSTRESADPYWLFMPDVASHASDAKPRFQKGGRAYDPLLFYASRYNQKTGPPLCWNGKKREADELMSLLTAVLSQKPSSPKQVFESANQGLQVFRTNDTGDMPNGGKWSRNVEIAGNFMLYLREQRYSGVGFIRVVRSWWRRCYFCVVSPSKTKIIQ